MDTGVSNILSIRNAFDFLEIQAVVSSAPPDVERAERLVLPGVGAFAAGMEGIRSRGLLAPLRRAVEEGKPILGICLGLQLFAERSREDGLHDGLRWIAGEVTRLAPADPDLKVPHVGFDTVEIRPASRLLAGLPPAPDFYFVHSYRLECDPALVTGSCDYGGPFAAVVEAGNVMGTQFHPEKSQSVGLRVLRNFAEIPAAPC